MKFPTIRQWKVTGAILLVILTIVVILQNTAMVETKILFISLSMPRAILLIVTLAVGVILGMVLAAKWTRPKAKPTEETTEK